VVHENTSFNHLVGIALLKFFHDVQYISLVWIYIANRVEKRSEHRRIQAFIFRAVGSALFGLYYRLIFAYGSLAYFQFPMTIETIKACADRGCFRFHAPSFLFRTVHL